MEPEQPVHASHRVGTGHPTEVQGREARGRVREHSGSQEDQYHRSNPLPETTGREERTAAREGTKGTGTNHRNRPDEGQVENLRRGKGSEGQNPQDREVEWNGTQTEGQ